MNIREAFEQGHIETDAIYWDGSEYKPSNEGKYAAAVAETANNLYREFKRGAAWPALTDHGDRPVRGDTVSIDVSSCEETAANRVYRVLTGDNNGDRTWLADLDHFNYVVPNEIEEALRYYADPEHYWTETQSYDGKYISNGVTEETYHCSDATPDRAREALKLIESKPPAEQGVGGPVGVIKHRTNPMSDNPDAYVDWQFGGDEINLPDGTELFLHPPKPTGGGVSDLIERAYMQGQIDCGVNLSYSNAKAYAVAATQQQEEPPK